MLDLLVERGAAMYGGEAVTQLEHGLQAAECARADGATEALQVAALLHDIGHVLHPDPEGASRDGIDTCHEDLGAEVLAAWFGPAVTEPVRLHVPAKRWLAREPAYRAALSEESQHTLQLQGGVFDDDEATAFGAGPHADAAIRLRRYDDAAKVEGLRVPDLDSWRTVVARVAKETQ